MIFPFHFLQLPLNLTPYQQKVAAIFWPCCARAWFGVKKIEFSKQKPRRATS